METEQLTTHEKWVKIEIQKEITNFLEQNKNENTVCTNTREATKARLRTKFIAPSPCIKLLERSYISYLTTHPKALGLREETMLEEYMGRNDQTQNHINKMETNNNAKTL